MTIDHYKTTITNVIQLHIHFSEFTVRFISLSQIYKDSSNGQDEKSIVGQLQAIGELAEMKNEARGLMVRLDFELPFNMILGKILNGSEHNNGF